MKKPEVVNLGVQTERAMRIAGDFYLRTETRGRSLDPKIKWEIKGTTGATAIKGTALIAYLEEVFKESQETNIDSADLL